jgi:hypothetical protein
MGKGWVRVQLCFAYEQAGLPARLWLFAIFKNNHKPGKRVLEKRIIPKEDIVKNDTFFLPNEAGTRSKATPNSFLGKQP